MGYDRYHLHCRSYSARQPVATTSFNAKVLSASHTLQSKHHMKVNHVICTAGVQNSYNFVPQSSLRGLVISLLLDSFNSSILADIFAENELFQFPHSCSSLALSLCIYSTLVILQLNRSTASVQQHCVDTR